MKNKLILASASPRRVQLLEQVGITPDDIIPADIDETPLERELPRDLAQRLAIGKAQAIAAQHKDAFILAADTVVGCGRRILDKAEDATYARKCLEQLSGRRHHVYVPGPKEHGCCTVCFAIDCVDRDVSRVFI